MSQPLPGEERRRETRLLVTTIVVSVGMLLLLARFRFPAEPLRPGTTEIAPAPLERLAARATYDELARVMADLEARLTPTVAVVPVVEGATLSYLPAPILAENRAVAVINRNVRVGTAGGTAPPLVARDPIRNLAVLDVSGRAGATVLAGIAPSTPGPRYVVVVEGTALGPVLRPLYVGRTDLYPDPRWTEPVLTIAAVQNVAPGAALFALDGSFIGLVSENAGLAMVVPAAALRQVVASAGSDAVKRSDLGIETQPLTTTLARGARASRGVMVSYVHAGIARDADIRPGDVIESIDSIGITTVAGFDEIAQGRTPGSKVTITRVRNGERGEIAVEAVAADTARTLREGFGAVLRTLRGVGAEIVSVEPYTTAAQSGLRRGDVVVALDERPSPDAAAIERAFRSAARGEILLLTVQGDATQRIVAVEKP
jgi:S1-C subfamily serine protease